MCFGAGDDLRGVAALMREDIAEQSRAEARTLRRDNLRSIVFPTTYGQMTASPSG